MARILIKNGRVWDSERFLHADVLTDGAQVARMASRIDEPADLAVLAFTDEGFSLVGKGQNRLSDTHGYRCKLTVCDGQVAYKD